MRAALLCALTAVSAVLWVPAANAGAPPLGADREVDAFDLFLDRARGDHVTDGPRAGSLALGATASFGASSSGPASFWVLGFVQVPFDRLFEDRRRALPATGIADRVPPLKAVSPVDRAPPAPPPPSAADRGSRSGARTASASAAAPASRALPAAPTGDHAPRSPSPPPAPAPSDPSARAAPAAAKSSSAQPDASEAGDALPELEPDPPLPPPLLTPALARGAVRAACKAAKLDQAEARLDSLASRAKVSALLPELRLRATRAIDESEALAPTEYDASRRTASGSTTTWLEARATFRLDRLVFADDEIAVERQRMARAAERTRLVTKVLELLDAWQRARAAEEDREAKPEARTRATLAATAAEASLDVLTDGWFSTAIAPGEDSATASRGAAAPLRSAAGPSSDPERVDARASK